MKLVRWYLVGGLVLLVSWLGGTSITAQHPSFRGLGDLPGGAILSKAFSVSADGQLVVGQSDSRYGTEAFVYDMKAKTLTGIGDLPGGFFFSNAGAVSGDNRFVTGVGTSVDGIEGFIYEVDTQRLIGVGDFPGGEHQSGIRSVSANGEVFVGNGSKPAGREAAIYKLDTPQLEGQGDLPGGELLSILNDVSADGSFAVGTATAAGYLQESVIFDLISGEIHRINPWIDSRAIAISADASTVVGQGLPGSRFEAYRYDVSTETISSLGYLPGAAVDYSQANDVSADGTVVVGFSGLPVFGSESASQAFIFTESQGLQPLQQSLVAIGLSVELEGWELSEAHGISADGRTIVGFGVNPEGATEAWVAVIPEPASAVVLGLIVAVGLPRRGGRCYPLAHAS